MDKAAQELANAPVPTEPITTEKASDTPASSTCTDVPAATPLPASSDQEEMECSMSTSKRPRETNNKDVPRKQAMYDATTPSPAPASATTSTAQPSTSDASPVDATAAPPKGGHNFRRQRALAPKEKVAKAPPTTRPPNPPAKRPCPSPTPAAAEDRFHLVITKASAHEHWKRRQSSLKQAW